MHRTRALTAGMLIAGFGLLGLAAQAAQQASGKIMLTDGNTMDRFDEVGNAAWRIQERSVAAERGVGFLVSKQSYDNFRLRAEFWADEGTNSGIFIRCENPQQPSAQSCYEINIFDSNPVRGNATGAIPNVAQVEHPLQTELHWNILEIEAKGPQLNVSVNRERTISVRDSKHARGRIALQRAAGVIYFKNVEIEPLTAADIEDQAEDIYAACQAGFALNFPGVPAIRDTSYTLATGASVPAKEYFVEKDGNRYSAISIEFPNGPYSDRDLVNQTMAQLGNKGQIQTQLFTQLGLGRQGGQMNIFLPNGRQLRAAVYMAQRKLTIAQADAVKGDPAALIFEQSIALINKAGNDLDRVNPNNNGETRKYDCR